MRIREEMIKSRARDPRKLNLTIRLVAPKSTPRAVLIDALERSIRYEKVQAPITAIHWVDWQKGTGGDISGQGRYIHPDLWQALKAFYAALTHPKTKLRIGRAEE